MFFTITVATYNRSRLLKRSLDSFKSQTFKDFEVLILDDCSTDDTQEVVQEYLKDERFKYIRFEKNLGFANKTFYAAQKKGMFKGEYVFETCDDDFVAEKEFLERVYNKLQQKKVDVVAFDSAVLFLEEFILRVNNNGKLPDFFNYSQLDTRERELLATKSMYLMRNDWLEKYDFFNEEVQNTSDAPFESSNEVIYQNATMCYVEGATYVAEVSPNARTKYIDLYNWIVSMGMYFDDTKEIELSIKKLKSYLTELSVPQNALVDWGGGALAEALGYFMGRKDYPIYLRKFAEIYKERFQEELNQAYSKFNARLLSVEESKEALQGRIVVYSDGNLSRQFQEQLKQNYRKVLFVADDYKEGYKTYKDILDAVDSIDTIFIATTNIKYIQSMFQKLEPIKDEVKIVTLIARDDEWRN